MAIVRGFLKPFATTVEINFNTQGDENVRVIILDIGKPSTP